MLAPIFPVCYYSPIDDMDTTLNFSQALHLLRMEPTKSEAIEFIAHLHTRGQINEGTRLMLEDVLDELFE